MVEWLFHKTLAGYRIACGLSWRTQLAVPTMEHAPQELKAMTKVSDVVAFVPMAAPLAATSYKEFDVEP